ncbi:hypothetical protein WMY93_026989 [Mugilogobius chulae]|uniref:Uncharacterized protein n=1 Tax=Mugilogobius chulae TaxID=88201 RepID=A0AAW0MSP2_9GOBI
MISPTTSLFDTIKVRAPQVSVRLKTHFSLKMENTLVFLLLLLCSFSSALEDREKKKEIQPCQSDIHAVLRAMTAALSEHKMKIEQLQSRNKEQEAKLAKLEKQSSEVGPTLQGKSTNMLEQ